MVLYPAESKQLIDLLQEEQAAYKAFSRRFFWQDDGPYDVVDKHAAEAELGKQRRHNALRIVAILDKIGEPSLQNIGAEAAQAMSVIASHVSIDQIEVLRRVLAAFTASRERDPDDTFNQAIPAMTDRLLLLERKPQRFGTMWQFDDNKQPFMPTIEDFGHVNERRTAYGIEPFRWPKVLAIPESQQPWLSKPLSQMTMRDLTDQEYQKIFS